MRSISEAIKDALREGWIFELAIRRADFDEGGYDKSTAIIYNTQNPYGSHTDRNTRNAVLSALRLRLDDEISPSTDDEPIIKQMDMLAGRHGKIRITFKDGQIIALLDQVLECPKKISGATLEEVLAKAK